MDSNRHTITSTVAVMGTQSPPQWQARAHTYTHSGSHRPTVTSTVAFTGTVTPTVAVIDQQSHPQ